MVNTDRWFNRVLKEGVVTEEMKSLPHEELLEYCGQLYRRMDRIIEIMNRARDDAECEHTLESVMYAIGKQASNEFNRRAVGYAQDAGDYDE